ncbi:TIGR01620 family protein [Aeromonas salmonicida]|uniref:YcjF family protein n=1 Tax=Aeromonas salmonicida TaxID=645 RepID=UPI00341D7C46
MNDQTKHRANETTPLQGKVILEPSVSVASEERPPAPAQPLEEASFERLDELDDFTDVEPALTIKPRRRHRLLAWGLGAVGLLSLGQYGVFLYDQLLTTPLWGSAWLLASGLVAVGTAGVVGREWLRLRTLKRRQDVRSRADDLLARQGVGQGQAFCEALAEKSGDKGREGYQSWLSQLDESHSDREVLTLYSQLVLTERDKLAQARVAKWSGEAAVLVALSPLATVDMMLMLWRNLRMIEDIADVYAIELGYWSRIRLIRQVFRNMLYAGATELVTEVGMDLLGAELAAKLSARAAQGVGAGLLTARLGLRTIEACRPLPWCGDEKPKLGELRKRLIGQLAGYLNRG